MERTPEALPAEGWQDFLAPGNRVAHYFVESRSLCGRVGFYMARLSDPLTPGKARADCAECRRLVGKRIAAQERAGAPTDGR